MSRLADVAATSLGEDPSDMEDRSTDAGNHGVLAICGDPIVGRALVLLLRGARYEVRFLPDPADPADLEGVQLVLLTPGAEGFADADYFRDFPVLELVSFGAGREPFPLRHLVPWPCHTEELRRRIEDALPHNHPGFDTGALAGPAG